LNEHCLSFSFYLDLNEAGHTRFKDIQPKAVRPDLFRLTLSYPHYQGSPISMLYKIYFVRLLSVLMSTSLHGYIALDDKMGND
jgi:hypothetical protein